jgi:hypothetical protein
MRSSSINFIRKLKNPGIAPGFFRLPFLFYKRRRGMKRILLISIVAFFVCVLANITCAAESDKDNENGRYALYVVEIEKKQTPVLLDTRTGKLWCYSEGQTSNLGIASGERPKFKGITVEGLVYSPKDIVELEKQIDLLHTGGFVNKNLLGFNEMMSGVFSYSLDLGQIKAIYEKSKLIQPTKD